MRGITGALVPAAIGGAGAIGLDVALAYIPLPAMLQAGWGRVAVQLVGAFGLGFIASKVAGRHNGQLVAAGALTVTAYSALKQVLAPTLGQSVKGLSGLADFSDYRPAWPGEYAIGGAPGSYAAQDTAARLGYYTDDVRRFGGSMGAYMGASHPEINPARFAGGRFGAYMRPLGAYMNPAPFLGAGSSPIRSKQMGAYGSRGLGGYMSEDM